MKRKQQLKPRKREVLIPHFHQIDDKKETIFDKILKKEIKVDILYEDSKVFAFHDVILGQDYLQANPQAPVHFLVIPKEKGRLSSLDKSEPEDTHILGHLLLIGAKIAKGLGLDEKGYRAVINNGEHGCQSVFHLHLHIIGGKQLNWPPG